MVKSRDIHVDAFQALADRCAEKWETIIGARPLHGGHGVDDDTLRRFGELLFELAEVQAQVNTVLSEALSELEKD